MSAAPCGMVPHGDGSPMMSSEVPDQEPPMRDIWRYWDWVMFALAASLTLWADVSTVEIAMLIVVVAGTTLWGAE
jgi:hypothetical protein